MDKSSPGQPDPDTRSIANLLPAAPSSPPLQTPSKSRSFSDSVPKLSPSPRIKESVSTSKSKDDILIATPSKLPRRNNLSLQMPTRDNIFSTAAANGGAAPSPQQEAKEAYVSPSTVLPRHSRGLDFSRASTNLHHTTSVDHHSSPGSSPTMSHKGLPSRRQSNVSMMMESPKPNSMNSWLNGSNAGVFNNTRPFGPSTALTSDASDSSDSDDDIIMRQEDADEAMLTTPQARRWMEAGANGGAVTPYGPRINSITSLSSSGYSPIARGMPHFRRQMSGNIHTRSMFGSFGEPLSRMQTNQSESQSDSEHSHRGSLTTEANPNAPDSRRESLTFGAQGLRVSPTTGDTEEPAINLHPMVPSVERRPVARRSNMLPKSKGFSRIKAMLKEESSPVDSEAMREAEIVRQVRVKDVGTSGGDESPTDLTPTLPRQPPSLEPSEMSDIDSSSQKPSEDRRNSSHKEFWWLLNRGRSSSGVSEDNNMSVDVPRLATPPPIGTSRSSTSNLQDIAEANDESEEQHGGGGVVAAFQTPSLPSAADVSRKVNNKRRRDDDWDPASIKRRAVSPGMSVASSPVMGHSPVSSSSPWWGSKNNGTNVAGGREGSGSSAGRDERAGSVISMGGVTPTLGPKRVGLQGMTDTNDGLMKMSIE